MSGNFNLSLSTEKKNTSLYTCLTTLQIEIGCPGPEQC